jgi:hypothetical protein
MYIRKILNGVVFIKKGNTKIKLEMKSKQNVEQYVIVCLHVYREIQKSLFVYMYIGKSRSHCLFTCISGNPEVIVCLHVYREIQKSLFVYMYIGKARSQCLFTCISGNPEVIVCLHVYREIQKSLFVYMYIGKSRSHCFISE